MSNTLNTGVYPEEYATKLQERLNRPVSWKEVCDVIYSDVKIFNMPYMSTHFSVQTGTRGTAYSFSDFALTNNTIDIATKVLAPTFVDRADLAQCTLVNQMELAERSASLLMENIETSFLADHGEWTDFGNNAGVFEAGNSNAITVSATNIDDIVRAIRREVIEANGLEMMNRYGLAFVWRASDFEFLEQYAQANGFNLADAALKNGIERGYKLLGAEHYVSNNHATGHVFGGVKKIVKIGILRTTWGQVVVSQEPSNADGPLSGVGFTSRADYDVMTPDGLATIVWDINVA